MIIFWVLAAGLLGLALLFVVTPLLSSRAPGSDLDQDQLNLEVFRQQLQELDADLAAEELDKSQYKAARRDLERELLYDVRSEDTTQAMPTEKGGRLTALVLAFAVPAGAIALYLHLGDSAIIPRLETAATAQPTLPAGHPGTAGGQVPPLEVLVQRLADKMEQTPDNMEGWLMLGRTYFAVNQPEKALGALEKAYGLAPENPEVITAYAQAVASNSGGKLAGQPAELIGAALKLDPNNTTALWLDGLASFQADDFAAAVERWEAILSELDPQGQEAAELRAFIANARQRGGMPPPQEAQQPAETVAAAAGATTKGQAAPQAAQAGAAPTGPTVTVKVTLAEPLWPQADRNDTLFVYAKAISGPPMPLAVKRLRVSDLPAIVTLDDSMAMMPAMRLSGFPEVTIGARISKSGQAMPQSGDLEGEVSPVKPADTSTVEVVIDQARP
jgi:cytochrome c-type biogenesis protein CcmH